LIAIISLILLLYLSLLATRFAAIILAFTGLSKKTAHFQARSALTGTGFTTKESELMMAHPLRRRVALLLMLFGNLGVVAMFATFLLGFLGEDGARDWVKLAILGAGLVGLWFLANSATFEKWLDRVLSRFLRRRAAGSDFDLEHLCHLGGDYKVTAIALLEGSPVLGKTVHQAFRGHGGTRLLGIERPDGTYLGAPSIDEILKAGDSLVVYGLSEKIEEISRDFAVPAQETSGGKPPSGKKRG